MVSANPAHETDPPSLTFSIICLSPVALPPLKASKNGTWVRLSGKNTESRPYPLSNGIEILIGTVRGGKGGSMRLLD